MMKQFERQKDEKEQDSKDLNLNVKKERLDKFLKTEGKLVSSSLSTEASTSKAKDESTTGTF